MQKFFWIISLVCMITLIGSCKEEPCETVACLNGGTCNEEDGSCTCADGYEGEFCEELVIQKFLGTYSISYEGCFTTSPNHTVSIEQITGEPDKVHILDLGDYACPDGEIRLEASISGSQIAIPSQTIDCGPIQYTFEGEGTFSGSGLSLSFTVNYDADGIPKTDSCTANLEK